MGRRSFTSAPSKLKTATKRVRSMARSVRKKFNRKQASSSGLKPYKSLFPVK